jgi:urease accessory protein UreF
LARKSKLDKLIDKLEEVTRMNQELMRIVLQTPLVPLPPAIKTKIGVAADLVEPARDDITSAYFDGLRAGAAGLQGQRAQEAFSQIEATDIIGPAKPVLPKPRSPKQKAFAKKQSLAFAAANKAVRKKNGQFRKGKSQRDVAKMAQRILRNGGTKKGQVRKTARRAYEKGRRKRSR